MRRLFLYTTALVAVIAMTATHPFPLQGQTVERADTTPATASDSASVMRASGAMTIPPLASGVVPPSPQAASIARYAEYPVSHTTGIPDINIPVYTIVMGDFSLPVSLSYHASGARMDDIPTCVGMGWTLNAGGAVTRTILGAPDLENAEAGKMDYSLYSYNAVRDAVAQNLSNGGAYDKIRGMLDNNPTCDTESDRYTLNAGKWSGVFRYSVADKAFVMLDHNNVRITSHGSGPSSYITAFCPDNTGRVSFMQDPTLADTGLNSGLATTSQHASAKGLHTGSVTYASDGTRTLTAIYYDIRGNVTEERKFDSSGTLSTVVNTYTYTGGLKSSSVSDRNLTYSVSNTYHTASGLLTASAVTANGVSQSTAYSYDNLGRPVSETRGNSSKGGSVTRAYDLHGQLTSVSGPGFSQTLHYTDGPGKALYNGSVSSMAWTMGTDATTRGYRYTYDSFGRLTEAAYGEGASLSDHKDRYTEKVPLYSLNGMIRRLQRHGLKDDGNYGKIDNLHVTLDGNRVVSVLEDADRVTYPGGMEYDGGKREQAMAYDNAGNLISDAGRGIASITYDLNNNPRRIVFSNGGSSEIVYSADGERLSVANTTSVARAVSAMDADADADFDPDISEEDIMSLAATTVDRTEYRGMAVYKDNKPYMLLFRGGYVTFESGVTFHYYTPDYLGNNRAVVNGTTGAIEQTVAYYPFGGVIADLGTGHSLQQYKFGGKELLTANGLNESDFGARRYYQAVPMFTQPDPFASKFPWLSPYAYCANNPVNAYDPDGNLVIFINGFYVTPTEGGNKSYWRSYKNWHFSFSAHPVRYRREKIYEFDIDVMRHLNDTKAKYVDGSLGGAIGMLGKNMSTAAEFRRQNGETIGLIDAPSIIASLNRDQDGNITEHIKVITHSMGSAYAKGYISSILKYTDDNGIKGVIFDFEADFAPYNTQSQEAVNHPNMGHTYQFSHSKDKIAGNKNISGAQMMDTSSDANQAHSIGSFVSQIQKIPVNIHTPKKK